MSSTTRPRAFCELPAGLASVSLRLHGGPHCRPPISRMGNKAGYAEVILAALGLRSGQGAGAYVWAEADPDVRALLRAYPDADMLRRIADIIRGWKDEEPRALWERLRAERKSRGAVVDDLPAGWIVSEAWGSTGQWCGPDRGGACGSHPPGWVGSITLDGLTDRCRRLAEYAQVVASNRLIPGAFTPEGEWVNTGIGGATFGGEAFATPAAEVASGFERVAGWTLVTHWSIGTSGTGFAETSYAVKVTQEAMADRYTASASGSRWPPVAVLATLPTAAELSAMLGTPGDLDGVVVYMDPPYVGTTGYLTDLPRADVVRLAREYDAAGAVVCISEAEPVIDGWHAIDIAAGRKGQKRTFSKQQREVLTMNREPAHRVAVQASLFGAA